MLMKKLSEEHYIIVDDSDITTGDIVAEKLLTGGYELFEIHTPNDIDEVRQKKVTHSNQPLGKPLFFTNAFESELSLSVNGLIISKIAIVNYRSLFELRSKTWRLC